MLEKLHFHLSLRSQKVAKTLLENASPTIRMIVMMFMRPIFLLIYVVTMEQVALDRQPQPQNRQDKSN